jgi:hypothetical protein
VKRLLVSLLLAGCGVDRVPTFVYSVPTLRDLVTEQPIGPGTVEVRLTPSNGDPSQVYSLPETRWIAVPVGWTGTVELIYTPAVWDGITCPDIEGSQCVLECRILKTEVTSPRNNIPLIMTVYVDSADGRSEDSDDSRWIVRIPKNDPSTRIHTSFKITASDW